MFQSQKVNELPTYHQITMIFSNGYPDVRQPLVFSNTAMSYLDSTDIRQFDIWPVATGLINDHI